MKRAITLSISLISLLLTSCKKDNQSVVNGITFVKNSKTWATTNVRTGFKPLDTKDTLFISAQNGEENIVIAIKQKGAGTYQPAEFKAYYYTTVGLDAVVSQYQLYNDPGNSIVITDYDENNDLIKGTFNFVLKSFYNLNNAFPDKIALVNGKMSTQLSDVYFEPFH